MAVAYKGAGSGVSTETSSAALSPACPATVDAGDVLLAHVYWEGTSSAPSTPAGWTLLYGPQNVGNTPEGRHWVFGKVAAGTEDGATVAFGAPAVTTQRGARIYSFSGRTAGNISELVRGFSNTTHATDPQMPTVTTTIAGSLAVALVSQNDNNAQASATGESGGNWTEAVAEYTANLTPGLALQLQTATPTADPGTISGGAVATTDDPCGVMGMEIRPAVPSTGVNARHFDGSDDVVTVDNGTLVATGAFSIFGLIRRKVDNAASTVAQVQGASGATYALAFFDTNQVSALHFLSDAGRVGPTVKVDDGWCIVGWTKAAGTVAPRQHVYKGGSWTHTDYPSTLVDGAQAAAAVEFARAYGSAYYDIEIAVVAAWDSALSDANCNTLDDAWKTRDWLNLSPTALWQFNQAAVGTSVIDETGNGADQTARTGTDVVDHGPTSWGFFTKHTATATLSGSGDAAATAKPTYESTTATLTGSGSVAATAKTTHKATGTLSGSGSVAATATRIATATGALSGSGSVSATAARTATLTATLSGSGTPAATARQTFKATATVSGSGSVTATATRTTLATGTLSSSGSLSATASTTHKPSATATGAGSLAATATRTVLPTATLGGAGSLAATATRTHMATATLAGAGTLSADAESEHGATTYYATGTITATGTPAATATRQTFAAATLTGSGSLASTAATTHKATATISGTGSASAAASRTATLTATLSGSGSVAATASRKTFATATLSGAGTLTADASAAGSHYATGTLSGSGALAATAARTAKAAGALTGSAALTATAKRTAIATGTLAGTGSLSGSASKTAFVSGSVLAEGSLTATPTRIHLATGTILGTATLTAEALSRREIDVALSLSAAGVTLSLATANGLTLSHASATAELELEAANATLTTEPETNLELVND